MISAVFDAMTLLQAAANRNGPAGACLKFVDDGGVELFLSQPIIDEIRDLFDRSSIRKAFPQLTDQAVLDFLERLTEMGRIVSDVPNAFHLPRDPDDEPYVNLAIAASSHYLVSRDRDLLDLMADAAFRTTYPFLAIVDPVDFLKQVRSKTAIEKENRE